MAYGQMGQLGIGFQSSYGTAETGSYHWFPLISESLNENIPEIVSEGMRSRMEEGDSLPGFHEIAGDVAVPAHPILIGKFLKAWCHTTSYVPALVASHYTHTFMPAPNDFDVLAAVPPMTIEVYRDAGSAHQYYDMLLNTLTLEIAHGAIIKATAGLIGGKFSKAAKNSPSYLTGSEWTWDQASMQIGGSAIDELSTMTITLNNNLAAKGTLDGTKLPNRIKRDGFRTIEVAGTALFISDTEFDIYRNQTRQEYIINVAGQACSSGYNTALEIALPSVFYTAFPPNIGGPGLIEASFTGKAKYLSTSGTIARFTLTNTLATY